jgi:hypothetical protein
MQTIDPHAVGSHYSQGQLAVRLIEALRLAGKSPDAPTTADLAGVDEFHVRGREATLELANLARLRRGARVLDVGGGIGGPARTRVRELIESFGLRQVLWNDATSVSREWLASRLSASGPPMPLGLHVILGSDLKPMMENVLRNFDERRMVVIQGVFTRP